MFEFEILKKSKRSKARLGILKTNHGVIETPSFVPVATQAAVKTLDSEEAEQTKSQVLICNTFHLHLRPGEKVVEKAGGLRKFMNWRRPLMTDSGGFQVFSLGFGKDYGMGKILTLHNSSKAGAERQKEKIIKLGQQPKSLKITGEGVYFNSPVGGRKLFIGPKESIKIQESLGADIICAFDECTSPIADYEYTKKSLLRTHKWAKECLEIKNSGQALYGIIQGGRFKDLRAESAEFIGSLPFEGFGIGGEFGDNKRTMREMLRVVINNLPEEKPRHLLGIGQLEDIIPIIKEGVDTFDCVVPTHYARRGFAFIHAPVPRGETVRDFASYRKLDLAKSKFLKDKNPLDKNCGCSVCQNYSRMYISHLIRAKEITGLKLLTFHNLYFFNSFIEQVREKIKQGKI